MDHYSIDIGDSGFDGGLEEERGVLIAKAALGTRRMDDRGPGPNQWCNSQRKGSVIWLIDLSIQAT